MRSEGVVRVLATGGTIATVREPGGRTAPRFDARTLVAWAARGSLPVEVEVIEVAQAPSWRHSLADIERIARAAAESARDPGVRGVIVTHGTTTMEYTAFLTDLYCDAASPVVFTGAMFRADAPSTDGPRNLHDALVVAASDAARGLGALLCMDGDVVAARDAWKLNRTGPGAFLALGGRLGRVHDDAVVIERRGAQRMPALSGPVEDQVALVKAYPGSGPEGLAAVLDAGARGLVLEGLPGMGGVPLGMHAWLEAAAHLPIVLASRAPGGALPAQVTGGTGEPLASLRLISAGCLTAEQAWVLLAVALGQGASRGDVETVFLRYAMEEDNENG